MDLDHYQRKVGEMRVKRETQKLRGKQESAKETERFQRNEQKLAEAQGDYDAWCNGVLSSISKVVDEGWQDMVPLTKVLLQFESAYFKSLVDTRDEIIAVAHRLPAFEPGSVQPLTERLSHLSCLGLSPPDRIEPYYYYHQCAAQTYT